MISQPHKKIEGLIKKYNLKQKDLTGGKIDATNISNIINGRQTLSKRVAEIIIKNFNSITGENKTVTWLMQTIESQVAAEIEVLVIKLKSGEEASYIAKDIEKILNDYRVEYELFIFTLKTLVKYYIEIEDYEMAIELSDKAIETKYKERKKQDRYWFDFKKAEIYITDKEYEKGLRILNYLEIQNDLISGYINFVYFNKGFIYKEKNMNIECKEELEKINTENVDLQIRAQVLLGNCYKDLKKYSTAIQIIIGYLDLALDLQALEFICLGYKNLCEVYYMKGDKKNCLKYKKKRLELDCNYHLPDHLFFFSTVTENLTEKYDLLKRASSKAFELNVDDKVLLSDIHNAIIKTLIMLDEYDNLKKWVDICYEKKINISNSCGRVCRYLLRKENSRVVIDEIINKM